MYNKSLLIGSLALVGVSAYGTTFTESEDNNSRAAANVCNGVQAGDTISGVTTGNSTTTTGSVSADYFKLNMASQSLGIYRNRLTLQSNTLFHTGAIVGLTTANVEANVQTSASTSRFNQWYSFGKGETVQYKVTGTSSTTAGYTAVVSQDVVTPTNLGTVTAGAFSIGTDAIGSADTELFLFDSNFNVIGMNDDASTTTAFKSLILSSLGAGSTYYIAVGRFNSASNLVSSAALSGGFEGFATGVRHEFGDLLTSSSSTATATNYALKINDTAVATGSWNGAADAYRMDFYSFNTVPEPGTMAALGLGAAALLRRRRK